MQKTFTNNSSAFRHFKHAAYIDAWSKETGMLLIRSLLNMETLHTLINRLCMENRKWKCVTNDKKSVDQVKEMKYQWKQGILESHGQVLHFHLYKTPLEEEMNYGISRESVNPKRPLEGITRGTYCFELAQWHTVPVDCRTLQSRWTFSPSYLIHQSWTHNRVNDVPWNRIGAASNSKGPDLFWCFPPRSLVAFSLSLFQVLADR